MVSVPEVVAGAPVAAVDLAVAPGNQEPQRQAAAEWQPAAPSLSIPEARSISKAPAYLEARLLQVPEVLQVPLMDKIFS